MKPVVLYIQENREDGKSRCLGRVAYNGAAHLRAFRAYLEGFREQPIVPWPFDFWDSQLSTRIATEVEQANTLELHDHVVTVIRSHTEPSIGEEEPMPEKEPVPQEPLAFTEATSSQGSSAQEDTSCLKLEPKHKIFLSHSGAQKPFVQLLCKDLEAHNHFAFFDQRSNSLPKGEEFAALIIDAAKSCQVAVVVLSEEYLSSKWPMVELVEFIRARKSGNKSLKLLPLFYKASVVDLSDESIKNKWRPRWMERVGTDPRVVLEEWVAAVRELRRVNGLVFEKFGNSEVSYSEAIVKEIFMLSPPNLLYDTSNIFGCDRITQELAGMFQPEFRTSAQVLGLYGMGGLGKTTMSKSLCNYFIKDYLGRVCYIEIKEGVNSALERQRMVMRKLLRLDESSLQRVSDVSEGWRLLHSRMKEHPVFLVIDNVQFDGVSDLEAREYLNIKYDCSSKIMIISRSLDVVQGLLGEVGYCHHIPCLTRDEAAGVFLLEGAPWLDYSSLTCNERAAVEDCLREGWFSHYQGPLHQNRGGHFHPLALKALGVYLSERSQPSDVLLWNTYLHEYGKLKDTRESYKRMLKILGLQFNTLDRMTQLMFVDISLYASKALRAPMLSNSPLEELIAWLANVHGKPTELVQLKIYDFQRYAMITIEKMEVIVHDLYKEYAAWYLGQLNCEEIIGVWCVGSHKDDDNFLPLELQHTPQRCWPYLKRIRLEGIPSEGHLMGIKVQEWCNIVVLQIVECQKLITVNLQGLACLRHLELKDLVCLQTLTFTDNGNSSSKSMSPPLQFVTIHGLSSLECLPSFSSFTSLKFLMVVGCKSLKQPPTVQNCSGLKRMSLLWHPNQKTLPSVDGLTSLQDLTIHMNRSESFMGSALKLEGLSSLISLGALELCYVPVGDLSGLDNLTCVEYICLKGMHYLTCLPLLDNLARSSLHVLDITSSNNRLEELDDLQSLIKVKLDGLAARGLPVPHTPSKIWDVGPSMSNLHFLVMDGSNVFSNLGSIPEESQYLQGKYMAQAHIPPRLNLGGAISNLISLDFCESSRLDNRWALSNDSLEYCPNVLTLNLSNCTSIIGRLSRLQVLDLYWCGKLQMLPSSIGQLTALKELRLGLSRSLEALPDSITALSQLQRLYLEDCTSRSKLPATVELMTGLLNSNKSLATEWLAVGIGQLNVLKYLLVRGCTDEAITALDSSGALTNLHQLSRVRFIDCPSMTKLPETIGLLTNLDSLSLWNCEKLLDLPNSVGQLKVLTRLFLRYCSSLETLPESLGALASLQQLLIFNCASITRIPASIGHLSGLLQLHVQGCGSLQSFPDSLSQLNGLARLEILDCGSSLEGLGLRRALQGLRIWGCTSITQLPGSCLMVVDSNFESPAWIWNIVQEISVCCNLKEVREVEVNDCGYLRHVLEDSESGRAVLQRVHNSSCCKLLTPVQKKEHLDDQLI